MKLTNREIEMNHTSSTWKSRGTRPNFSISLKNKALKQLS